MGYHAVALAHAFYHKYQRRAEAADAAGDCGEGRLTEAEARECLYRPPDAGAMAGSGFAWAEAAPNDKGSKLLTAVYELDLRLDAAGAEPAES
jgi:hypothetical protein